LTESLDRGRKGETGASKGQELLPRTKLDKKRELVGLGHRKANDARRGKKVERFKECSMAKKPRQAVTIG